jgi:hypothetical protein
MSRRRSAFVCFGSPVLTRPSSWSAAAARLAASGPARVYLLQKAGHA